jgi:[lysine-biosynthesis-protein LysW]---L-2-aminoadipate ligase
MNGRIAIVADRIGWEERELISRLGEKGVNARWVNDESLCLGVPPYGGLGRQDVVLIRSRSYTRGGLLADVLASSGVRTLNSAEAIRACENKLTLRCLLYEAGIPVPDFRLILSRKDFQIAVDQFGLPLVIKPIFGGMGRRVFLLQHSGTAHSFYDYIEDLGHSFEQSCLVEPYLGDRSIRCFIVGEEIVAAAEFQSGGPDEWRSNAATGSRQRTIICGDDIRKIVDEVVQLLGHGIYGIDLFETPTGFVVSEVNHAPGFRAVATAAGVDIASTLSDHLKGMLK